MNANNKNTISLNMPVNGGSFQHADRPIYQDSPADLYEKNHCLYVSLRSLALFAWLAFCFASSL